MRTPAIIILILFFNFFATAQKSKSPAFYFTSSGEKYLSDTEVDSLYYSISQQLFNENGIPQELFEKKFPGIRSLLITMSRGGIIQSFKEEEAKLKSNNKTEKEPLQFNEIKKLYTESLGKQIRSTFHSNKTLSQYLSINNRDRITYFKSMVRVGKNGKLLVQETITVYNGNGQVKSVYWDAPVLSEAEGMNNEIKRGIVRAFPLYYINKYKLFLNTTFKLKEVLKGGEKENYHTEKYKNGILVYTGRSDIFLEPGKYTYTITYETDYQLKYLNDYDELYWNVIGNSWSFRIDSASCTVILPKGAHVLSNKCYTGLQGMAGEDCRITSSTVDDSSIISFKTTTPLLPNQGLTIATSWQKGIVKGPSFFKQALYYIGNNKGVFFLPIAALFSAIFCFIFWYRYGRDPKKGIAYPRFEPPAGYSPAALGYIYFQKFDRQLTAATIVDAAVRNKIKINVEREGFIFKHNEYIISESKMPAKPPVSNYEEFESDIIDLVDTTIEKGKYNSELGSLNTKVQSHCENNYKSKDGWRKKKNKGFFALNNSYTAIPILLCLVAAGWGFLGGTIKAIMMFNFWSIGYFIAGIILCIVVLKIFSKLLRAYSPEGQQLRDKIEGFRMFISAADEKRFDMMNPPKKSLELYEKYLPFAIALGCEIEWGQKFEDIISTAVLSGAAASSFSQSFTRDNINLTSSFASSFSGAISSASSPPSSSSSGGSSFGGGSSGGGGGGGGGGGW